MKLYVQASSKKSLNDRLAKGEKVIGQNYSMFGGAGLYPLDSNLPVSTDISIYEKIVGGSPYATRYGTWDGTKVK